MKKAIITQDLRDRVIEMANGYSIREIAEELKVSTSTVNRIIKAHGIERSKEDESTMRSRIRKNLVRAERRRALFGFDQRTNIKIFTNRECAKLKYCLKRRKYIFLHRGDKTAYFDAGTVRHDGYEKKGVKLGLKFQPLESQIS